MVNDTFRVSNSTIFILPAFQTGINRQENNCPSSKIDFCSYEQILFVVERSKHEDSLICFHLQKQKEINK